MSILFAYTFYAKYVCAKYFLRKLLVQNTFWRKKTGGRNLARISHRLSAATPNMPAYTALRLVDLLGENRDERK